MRPWQSFGRHGHIKLGEISWFTNIRAEVRAEVKGHSPACQIWCFPRTQGPKLKTLEAVDHGLIHRSPEHEMKVGNMGRKSDIWALNCICYPRDNVAFREAPKNRPNLRYQKHHTENELDLQWLYQSKRILR